MNNFTDLTVDNIRIVNDKELSDSSDSSELDLGNYDSNRTADLHKQSKSVNCLLTQSPLVKMHDSDSLSSTTLAKSSIVIPTKKKLNEQLQKTFDRIPSKHVSQHHATAEHNKKLCKQLTYLILKGAQISHDMITESIKYKTKECTLALLQKTKSHQINFSINQSHEKYDTALKWSLIYFDIEISSRLLDLGSNFNEAELKTLQQYYKKSDEDTQKNFISLLQDKVLIKTSNNSELYMKIKNFIIQNSVEKTKKSTFLKRLFICKPNKKERQEIYSNHM